MSWMRPRPQFRVSGRVNSPHFEHSVTRLSNVARRGSGLGKLKRIAIERLADYRAHAVGADHELGLDLSAIGESEEGPVASLRYLDQAVPEMNGAVIEPACKRVQEIRAVKGAIGRAVPLRRLQPVVEFEKLTGLHVARVDPGRQVSYRGDVVADTDRSQRFDGLGTCIDRGTDLAQGRSLLEHLRFDPKCLERIRGREPGKPSADDRDPTAR